MFMGEADIGFRSSNFPTITQVGMVDCRVALLIIVLPKKVFTVMIEVIEVVTTEEVYFGLNIPDTLTLSIVEEALIVMGEVYIGLRPSNLPTIT